MAVKLSFFLDVVNGAFVASDLSLGTAFAFRPFVNGDTVLLSIGLVQPDPAGGPGALSKIPNAGITLKAAIGTPPTALTNVTLAAAATGIYMMEGVLPLNVAAIDNLFTSTPTAVISSTFELELTESGNISTFQAPINIKNSVITTATLAVAPPDRALSVNEGNNSFVKLRGTTSFIMTDSADGTEHLVTLSNGQFSVSPLT